MENKENGNYIFFLVEKDDEIPKWFFQLSLKFSVLRIKLVPVTLRTFMSLVNEMELNFLIVAVTNLRTKFYFEKALKSPLGFAVKAGKLKIFHLSSFGDLAQHMGGKQNKNYFYYKLPLDMDFVVREMNQIQMKDSQKSDRWPGGKNKKFPLEIIG